jgi:L-rhamnose mutarotase
MKGYYKTTTQPTFKRYCKVLRLKNDPELIKKYIEVHKHVNIWPVISEGIRKVGIIDMEIYIRDNMAFMIMDTVPEFDHDKAMKILGSLPKQKEWEEYVSQFQDAGAKADTPEKWEIVERVFELNPGQP